MKSYTDIGSLFPLVYLSMKYCPISWHWKSVSMASLQHLVVMAFTSLGGTSCIQGLGNLNSSGHFLRGLSVFVGLLASQHDSVFACMFFIHLTSPSIFACMLALFCFKAMIVVSIVVFNCLFSFCINSIAIREITVHALSSSLSSALPPSAATCGAFKL